MPRNKTNIAVRLRAPFPSNFLFFALDHWVQLPVIKMFYLNHVDPTWWQFITCTFCRQLGSLIVEYFLFIHVGKLIEEEEGAFGVWFSYIATGTGRVLSVVADVAEISWRSVRNGRCRDGLVGCLGSGVWFVRRERVS